MSDKIVKEFTTQEYNDILDIQESIRVAKKAAEEAHAKGMSRQEADSHIYDKVVDHIYSKPSQGAGGAVSRIKADMHTDKGLAHFDKLSAKSKESKNESVEFTAEELQALEEISKKLAVNALAHRKERAYADFEAGNDPEKSSEWKKEKKVSSMVAKKHGSGAVRSAEKKSHKLLGYNPFDENFNSVEMYTKAISEQVRKERGYIEESLPGKLKDYDTETVSKDKDHHIKFTHGDDNDMHYHGHIGGKKFVATSHGEEDDQSGSPKETHKATVNSISKDLKKSGITGEHHDKAMKAISAHAKKVIHDAYGND